MKDTKKIQKMLDNASSIEIDGIALTGWTMDSLSRKCSEDDDVVFQGYAETEGGDYHWNITAEALRNADISGHSILTKDDNGEECEIQCFKKIPYTG